VLIDVDRLNLPLGSKPSGPSATTFSKQKPNMMTNSELAVSHGLTGRNCPITIRSQQVKYLLGVGPSDCGLTARNYRQVDLNSNNDLTYGLAIPVTHCMPPLTLSLRSSTNRRLVPVAHLGTPFALGRTNVRTKNR